MDAFPYGWKAPARHGAFHFFTEDEFSADTRKVLFLCRKV
jgi:hypothetical protein